MNGEYTTVLKETMELVRQAAQIMCRDDFEIKSKGSVVNIVTSADIAIQEFLKEHLCAMLPGSAFFGEEGAEEMKDREFVWIVDPIDGTMNFSRKLKESSISVGLYRNGKPVIGVVYNPFKEEMYIAEEGMGAYLNTEPIHASSATFAQSIFCTAWSLYNKQYAPQCMAIMEEAYAQCNDFRRFGSCALELCYLAAGRCDLHFEMRVFPWDIAAASLILQEAGGVITGLDGLPLPMDRTTPVIAANNQENYEKLIGIVRKHVPCVPYEEIL